VTPSVVDGRQLLAGVARLTAASLIARHWLQKGERHEAALALAGMLLRSNWKAGDVEEFVFAVARVAGYEEAVQRKGAVRSTVERLRTNGKATGPPTLATLLNPGLARLIVQWVKTGTSSSNRSDRVFPAPHISVPPRVSNRVRAATAEVRNPKSAGEQSKLPTSVCTGLAGQYLDPVGPGTEAPAEFHLAS
jgi:hypothetical protein